eukprot:6936490-Alexandrium_andersonii.AAC.1
MPPRRRRGGRIGGRATPLPRRLRGLPRRPCRVPRAAADAHLPPPRSPLGDWGVGRRSAQACTVALLDRVA